MDYRQRKNKYTSKYVKGVQRLFLPKIINLFSFCRTPLNLRPNTSLKTHITKHYADLSTQKKKKCALKWPTNKLTLLIR